MVKRKLHNSLIAGLDLGSSAVRLAVGSVSEADLGEELHILAAAEAPSRGIHRGVVNSIEDTVSAISMALERAEKLVGLPVEQVWVGISGTHVQTMPSTGTVAVAKSNGEIAQEDIERAIDAARTVATPLNYEILHVVPLRYTVDGQSGVKNPVGMSGVRFEVETQIIQGVSAHIKNVGRAVYRSGLDISEVVLSVLAASEAVLSERQKELGVAVVCIGGSTTGIAVFEDGDLLTTAILPVGSDYITNDLAIGLKTDIDVAQEVKVQCSHALAREIDKKETINLKDVGALSDEQVSRRYIAEITQARVEEIFSKVDEVLQSVHKSGKLPAGIILTGGGAAQSGMVELAKESLHLPASLGYPTGMTTVTDRAADLNFSTAVGLVKWGYLARRAPHAGGFAQAVLGGAVAKASGQIKNWFQSLLP